MMEDHLYCKDLYEPITFQTMPEGKIEKEWELLNRKAVAMIRKYIDKSLFEHVSTYTNAYELWSKLESMIQKKTPRNKAHLVRRLVKLEYNDGQSMIEHLNNFKGLVNQLSKIEMKIDEELQALLLLSSLLESWDTLVVTLSNSAPYEANVVENRGRSNNRIKNENRGRSKTRGYDKSRGQSKSRSKIIYYYCGKPNHKKSECQSLKRDQKNGTVKCDQVDPKKKEENSTTAVVATPHGDFFSTYQTGDFGAVKMRNQETSKIVGIENVILKTNTDCEIVLNDVRHVPDMRLNLISAGKLDDAGYMNLFDVCSMNEKSMGGALYFVTFIDDHSRKVWIYLLKTKDQVLEAFKEFHAKVERQTGRKLKCVRSDNGGGEYRGPFEKYCKSYGIRFEKTPPKTPQLNGVAERMNKTIEERVRSMLSNAQLSKSFWGEAVKTATKIVNHSPSSALDGEIPEQVWRGKNVSYEHFKVFGCRAFVHIPKDERSKLDAKKKQCIYLDTPQDEFGHRLWDPVNKRIVRSWDVVFLEDHTIEDTKQSVSPVSKAITQIIQDPMPVIRHETIEEQNAENQDENNDSPTDESSTEANEDQPIETIGPEVAPELEVTPQSELRRSVRERRPSNRYPPLEYVIVVNEGEPQSFDQAMGYDHKEEWLKAMQEEMQSLHENQTYDLVELPKRRRALKNKWVYKLKTDESNKKPRHKAGIVVKGCNQKEGIDFEEIFSLVVKMSSIRVVLSLVATLDLEVEQLDVKTTFLHGDLEEEIYMEQPRGFIVPGKENLVCRLRKSLYDLKQAPRQWYKKFDSFMTEHQFKKTQTDHCVFVKRACQEEN
ncbi:hypothetical protein GQ457_15G024680 [Hibiscus cannabinus]